MKTKQKHVPPPPLQAALLERACDDTKRSVRLRELLGIVLKLGNKLNANGGGPTARGFTLDSLLKAPARPRRAAAPHRSIAARALNRPPPNPSSCASPSLPRGPPLTAPPPPPPRGALQLHTSKAFDKRTSILHYLIIVLQRSESAAAARAAEDGAADAGAAAAEAVPTPASAAASGGGEEPSLLDFADDLGVIS